jgi:thioredoxin reductase (NADPH)
MALAERMASQATRFGAEILYEEVVSVDLSTYPYEIKTYGPTYHAKTLIICTGTSPRKLAVPGEAGFIGRGVSFCATCDGYFYKDKTVVVVGGGDSALEEGLYLTRFAQEVIIVHRRGELRAGALLQQRAHQNPKIRFVMNTVVEEILGEKRVSGVRVRNLSTGEMDIIAADGVFEYVGLIPNVSLFKGQLELTPRAIFPPTSGCVPACRGYLPPGMCKILSTGKWWWRRSRGCCGHRGGALPGRTEL